MPSQATFTGRTRRRRTHPWVKAGDRLARVVITLGGIGTIAAVLTVAVFLLMVALPLFRQARISPERSFPVAGLPSPGTGTAADGAAVDVATGAGVACMGADETGSVVWLLDVAPPVDRDAAEPGRLRIFALADGTLLQERSAGDCGLAGVSAIRVLPGSMHAVAGFADGTFRIGRLGLESAYLADGDLPAGLDPIATGSARAHGGDVIVRAAGGQHATVRLIADLSAPPSPHPLAARVIDVDITMLSSGPVVAALDAGGRVRVETASSRRNLLTDEVVTTASGSTIDVVAEGDGFTPRFVRVSELGDELFVIAADGAARRYDIRDVESPGLRESFEAAPADVGVTAAVHVFGGSALAVADAAGVVRVFFATRAADAAAADGLRMVGAKVFAPRDGRGPPAPVTALAASPRSRLLAVADAAGGIRLLQTTTGATVASVQGVTPGTLEGAATGLLLTPRENRLLAVDGRRLASWGFTAGYPQISWRSLFGRVWYEKYPDTVHAWETTGHEAFESKFGLVPLIFGTIKATAYSMLFAVPVAILAAIYASQFMHPRWKARIKPTIEMMASLPSVVLGFIAGLILAPVMERSLMTLLSALFCVPLALLACAHLWLLVPTGWRSRFASWRFPLIAAVALPAGGLAARLAAAPLERLLFQGDVAAWLDGRGGSGFGGWVVALLPLASVAAAATVGRFVHPWLRRASGGWSQRQAGLASLVTFVVAATLAVSFAVAAAAFFDALRLDTRGGLFGTYVQRNSLVVAIGMSFAIIPLIFTIAEDALSAVPDHLRSASLGAGATPWQTAVRVIVPAATSGLFSAVMIGLGRAVGETMIVLMAAGNTPLMEWNIFNGFQTLSAAIATELPEAARGSAHYRVLFLAALTLFAMTFVVNTVAELVRQRFRRRAHEL